ncbi:MAG: putative mycofactocin system creatinine amidohydrolase family protein MftE [Acidimicrobiales bacterium]|nr:MAG: putative mycofactocin system creatinine amidohydrolase family protein MftE [Acidimicrobiales bacterium]
MRLAPATTAELEGGPRTLLLPLGATEQHGPHLPLDTDTRIAVAVADAVAARGDDLVVAPPIGITASGEHAGFAGTLSIGTKVLADVLVEIVRTAGPEFARVVVINGHGGNAYALRAAAATCESEGRPLDVWSIRLPDADAHAGRTETSLLLHLSPEVVHVERAEPGNTEPLETLLPQMMESGVRAVAANGVLGDPRGASAGEGEVLFAALVEDAVGQILGG